MKKIIVRILCFALGIFLTDAAFADTWTGNTDENWFDPSNWASGVVPTGGTDITVDNPVSNSPNIATGSALAHDIALGLSVGGSGTLNLLTGGNLSANSINMGVTDVSSSGTIITDTNSVMNITNNIVVGANGSGTFDVLGSSVVNSGSGTIGQAATGGGTVVLVGSGSQWNNSGTLIVGDQGSGTLVAVTGSVVTNKDAIVSNQNSGNSGSISIANAGSKWISSGNLTIANGLNTSADMDISDGGTVSAVNTVLANQSGSTATVTLENPGTLWNNASLIIGQGGTASVTLADSAQLNVSGTAGIIIGANSVLNIGAADGSAAVAGGQLTSPTINLNNNAAIIFNHTDLANVVNANISGGGSISQEGSGTTVLNGSNSYTGGTVISAGILQGSSSGLQGSILNNSHLIFDQTGDGVFTGVISGSGDVTKNNNGTVILQNANSFTGGLFITAGTLQIADEASLGDATLPVTFNVDPNNANAIGTLAVAKSLTLQQSLVLNNTGTLSAVGKDTVVIPTDISGAGNLFTAGTGTVLFNTPMSYTGTTTISQGTLAAGASNILTNTPSVTIAPNGVFDLNGFTQTVNNLQNNGVITLAPDTGPLTTNTLIVNNNLSGNGSVKMTTDLVNQINDVIRVNGRSAGQQKLILNNPQQAVDPVPSTALKLVQTSDGIATFSGGTDAGSYEYVVARGNGTAIAPDPHAWYLVRLDLLSGGSIPLKDVLSSTATAAIGMFSAGVPLFYADMQTLITRMGDLRLGDNSGAWLRTFGNKMQIDNQISRPFNQNSGGLQAGVDKALPLQNNHLNLGVFTDYQYAAQQFHQNATGATQSFSLGAYSTFLWANGWYADVVAKYTQFWNNFQATTFSGLPSRAYYRTPAVGGSIETGKKIIFAGKNAFFIEPQLQLTTAWIESARYSAGNGLQIHGSNQTSLAGRIGLRSGVEFNLNKHRVIEPYLQVALLQEFHKFNTITTNNTSFQTQLPQTIKRFGAGIATRLAEKAFLYGEYYYAVGQNFREPVAFNIGLRVNW